MKIDLVFIVLLLGHVLGDFYLQTNKMAEKEEKSIKMLLCHGGVYALCMCAVLVIGMPITRYTWLLLLFCSIFHLFIEFIKYALLNKTDVNFLIGVKNRVFILGQCLHLITLIIAWYFFGSQLTVRWFISQEMLQLPDLPITILLGLLCILRPVGLLIVKGKLWEEFNKYNDESKDNTVRNAGRMIGYLERIIIFLFLLYRQFGAIAFVLTAKSVARFKEIELDRMKAEYYLIGTLLSVVSAFLITFLLGLCGSGL